MVDGIDFHNGQRHVLPQLHLLLNRRLFGKAEIVLRHEALQVVPQVDDHAVVLEPHDPTVQLHADGVLLADLEPRILLGLLQPQRYPLVVRVDVEDHHLYFVRLLYYLRGVLHPLGPRHVRNMNQSVDAWLDFNEGSEGRQVAHLAGNPRTHGVFHRKHHPRILLGLLHAEGNLLFLLIHFEYDRFDSLANRHHGGRMAYRSGPAHFADVHEAFDARLEFDERPVIGDADNLALQP